MGFAQSTGYIPLTIQAIMSAIKDKVNIEWGTAYTDESFVGTNHYRFFYALAQRVQENEIKTSEIFIKLQQYFKTTNERIQRPVATNPGLVEVLEKAGFIASLKPMVVADAGKVSVAVDTNELALDYAAKKLAINTILKNSIVAGVVTQGTEVSSLDIGNGQYFDFKFVIPTRTQVRLRLTLTLSDNNQVVVGSPESVKQKLIANISSKYRLGRDFEPQRYFTTVDAPWTAQVLLEWSIDNGTTWHSEIYEANYNEIFVVSLANITLIENN